MSWSDKQTVKKGDIGEQIVTDYLEKKGMIVYEPVTHKAHGFDKLVTKGKDKLIIVEVKTKARRNNFPDTGIDYRHYLGYKTVSKRHNIPVWIFFVDEMLGEIYGNNIEILETPNSYLYQGKSLSYPLVKSYDNSKIIYFYQPSMIKIHSLTPEQIIDIKKYSSRNYNYVNR